MKVYVKITDKMDGEESIYEEWIEVGLERLKDRMIEFADEYSYVWKINKIKLRELNRLNKPKIKELTQCSQKVIHIQ